MTALAGSAAETAEPDVSSRRWNLLAFPALYLIAGVLVAMRHEPWADEAHSWLLARDASLGQLWTNLLHYEGTPGLWQTLLHLLIRIGTPWAALNVISAVACAGAAVILALQSRLNLLTRATLPFTYYLFYQYGVVARSYSLLPVLVFACAALYLNAQRHPVAFTSLIVLLMAVSLDGFVLGAIFWASSFVEARGADHRRDIRWLASTAAVLAIAPLLAWAAWPASDNQFVTHLNLSVSRLGWLGPDMLRYALTGEWFSSAAVLLLSWQFLRRGRTLALFIAVVVCLWIVHSLIYVEISHIGVIFLAWVFCLWIAAERVPLNGPAAAALAIVIGVQAFWTVRSALYDITSPFSGSRGAAASIHALPDVREKGLRLAGYSAESVKAYFTSGELRQLTRSNQPAYWDWSVRGTGNDPAPLLTDSFGYFLAGYKLTAERDRWASVAALSGYERIGRFEGNLFWRTDILETESFDLYRRRRAPGPMGSSVDMSNTAVAPQLLRGFGEIESGQWRWTEKEFAAALGISPEMKSKGADLQLRLYLPDAQIGELGPMTLRASVNGHSLPAVTWGHGGDAVYLQSVPAAWLTGDVAIAAFSFDRARRPNSTDNRELGAVARAISLSAK